MLQHKLRAVLVSHGAGSHFCLWLKQRCQMSAKDNKRPGENIWLKQVLHDSKWNLCSPVVLYLSQVRKTSLSWSNSIHATKYLIARYDECIQDQAGTKCRSAPNQALHTQQLRKRYARDTATLLGLVQCANVLMVSNICLHFHCIKSAETRDCVLARDRRKLRKAPSLTQFSVLFRKGSSVHVKSQILLRKSSSSSLLTNRDLFIAARND